MAVLLPAIAGATTAPRRFALTTTSAATVLLPGPAPAGKNYLRRADGKWLPVQAVRLANGAVALTVPPVRCGMLLLNRPAWLDLNDDTPPRLCGATLEGRPLPLGKDAGVDLGCLSKGTHWVTLTVRDADNPIDAGSVRVETTQPPGECTLAKVDMPGDTAHRATIRLAFNCRTAGTFETILTVADNSAMRNARQIVIRHAVMGIAVSDDRQEVRLSNGRLNFVLRPGRDRQLQLPNGVWAKLTTNMDGTWLYPRHFTSVKVTEDSAAVKTVRVLASVQSLEGRPVEGLAQLELELSVRKDTPALLVRSRAINISRERAPTYANWGWLPGADYVLPAGVRQWRGKAADRYFDVGWPGWLWLAPLHKGAEGIAWMSPEKFGESRFNTMLLYSARRFCKPGQGVSIEFAIALTKTVDEARRLYEDLVGRNLLQPPKKNTASKAK